LQVEPISTDRLDLLPLRADHADEMAGVLADPALYDFTGGVPPTRRLLRARYERQVAGSGDPAERWYNWVIRLREAGRLCGTVQATVRSADNPATDQHVAEVAWVIGVPWQGQGIATEAARALIAWLAQLPALRVIAHIHPGNQASAAVASACGLAPTGHWQGGEMRWQLTLARP
jgi:RimJ/RimL family protein N-acetyltransferase